MLEKAQRDEEMIAAFEADGKRAKEERRIFPGKGGKVAKEG